MIKKYTLKNGEIRYKFQVYLGTNELTGKQERTTRRGFKSKKQAELELARIKLQVANKEFRQRKIETFNDVYNLWIIQYEKTVEESTFVKTEGIFKNHILPSLGAYKIDKITIEVCQEALNEWSNKLKRYAMVKSYASKVFDFAVKRDYISRNPFQYVELPRKKHDLISNKVSEKNFYTKEQLLEFLYLLEKENNRMAYVFFRLLAFTGMRKGEAFSLTWGDVNFKKNELHINKALSRGKDNKLYVKSTKTNDVRNIIIDSATIDILKEWKKYQQDNFDYINTHHESQLIFSNSNNQFIQPSMTRKWIRQVQLKYDLKQITTHGLRHTHCSLLFEAGASLKEVQDRLGHSDIQTTMNIYTHVTEKAQEEAINKFSNYLNI
ncbi:site-specific integrase [Savagea sp. SN6]|uniref:Site-specific integrase n=1 Tax=Savagea serpentis TaxID=2785297 RepID=A0A8J7G6I4_9BACL|nr:site-specific integrase [Savagea serpentis]MBF4501196.1 site-specific integrase [Savagea serpentis]